MTLILLSACVAFVCLGMVRRLVWRVFKATIYFVGVLACIIFLGTALVETARLFEPPPKPMDVSQLRPSTNIDYRSFGDALNGKERREGPQGRNAAKKERQARQQRVERGR